VMSNRRLAAAHRIDRHELERVVQSAHVATPCSRKMSLRAVLL
jgi:hypothetical protein